MTRAPLIGVFAGVFVLAIILLTPMRVAISLSGAADAGLSASAVDGTIWNGRLRNASLRDLPLGDLAARLDPVGLSVGKIRLQVKNDGATALDGGLVIRRRGVEPSGLSVQAPLKALGLPSVLDGRLDLRDLTLRFVSGRCRKAQGQVAMTPAQALPPVTGVLTCRGDDALAVLTGEQDGIGMRVEVRIDSRGVYTAQTRLQASNPGLLGLFGAAGFDVGPQAATRTDSGRL